MKFFVHFSAKKTGTKSSKFSPQVSPRYRSGTLGGGRAYIFNTFFPLFRPTNPTATREKISEGTEEVPAWLVQGFLYPQKHTLRVNFIAKTERSFTCWAHKTASETSASKHVVHFRKNYRLPFFPNNSEWLPIRTISTMSDAASIQIRRKSLPTWHSIQSL